MLEVVGKQFSVGFDHIFSAETAGSYKPHPSVYGLPEKLLGITRQDTLHIAGGATDVVGTVAYGMPCFWSNKTGEVLVDPTFAPNYEIADLSNLGVLLI